MAGNYLLRFLTTTKARNGDHFIMEVPDRQVTVTSYEGTDSLTTLPYPGFEPENFGVANDSLYHYIALSTRQIIKKYIFKKIVKGIKAMFKF